MNSFSSFVKKAGAGILVLAFIAPFLVLPQRAQAQVIVEPGPILGSILGTTAASTGTIAGHSVVQETRESILNGIAWMVAKVAIQSITRSIVNWINSGFNGSPAFVTDLKRHLLGVGDGIANQFVAQLTINAKISSPFLNSVVKGVAAAYYLSSNKDAILEQLKYNLSQTVKNDQAFLGGQFSQGGFNGWFAASQDQNNPWGTQIVAERALNDRIDAAVQNRLTELNWGKGFLSWRKCSAPAGGSTELSGADDCTNAEIQTPGSVIESQLENSLGTGIRQLELADSFNEIVSALMGQLVGQVLGGSGLSGSSQSSAGNTRSYLDQTANDNSGNASLQQSFLATIDRFVSDLTKFQQNWSIIRNAAQEAQTALVACGTDSNAASVLSNTVQPVLTEATTHITAATTALTEASSIRSSATNTSSNDPSILLTLSTEYNALIAGFNPEDFTEATLEASDSTNPLSIYTHMKQIASQAGSARGCLTVH